MQGSAPPINALHAGAISTAGAPLSLPSVLAGPQPSVGVSRSMRSALLEAETMLGFGMPPAWSPGNKGFPVPGWMIHPENHGAIRDWLANAPAAALIRAGRFVPGAAVALTADAGLPLAGAGRLYAPVAPASILDSEFAGRGGHVLSLEEHENARAHAAVLQGTSRAAAAASGSAGVIVGAYLHIGAAQSSGSAALGPVPAPPQRPKRRRPVAPTRTDLSGVRGASEDVPLGSRAVARAVADTPPAPDLAPATIVTKETETDDPDGKSK